VRREVGFDGAFLIFLMSGCNQSLNESGGLHREDAPTGEEAGAAIGCSMASTILPLSPLLPARLAATAQSRHRDARGASPSRAPICAVAARAGAGRVAPPGPRARGRVREGTGGVTGLDRRGGGRPGGRVVRRGPGQVQTPGGGPAGELDHRERPLALSEARLRAPPRPRRLCGR